MHVLYSPEHFRNLFFSLCILRSLWNMCCMCFQICIYKCFGIYAVGVPKSALYMLCTLFMSYTSLRLILPVVHTTLNKVYLILSYHFGFFFILLYLPVIITADFIISVLIILYLILLLINNCIYV